MKKRKREFRSSSTCFGAMDAEPLTRGAKLSLLIAVVPVALIYLSIRTLRSKRNNKNNS